ncbi:MAG TPA: hypothetical protein VIA06_08220 [Candidatus Dormibacteraeota bacterium]|jgi:hypothetical protein|nr:hypothetical protein [Candidatus Dormibacteraeota bacterium]
MVVLETGRLVARDYEPADRDAVDALLSRPEVIRHLQFAPLAAAQRRRWFDERLAEAAREARGSGGTRSRSAAGERRSAGSPSVGRPTTATSATRWPAGAGAAAT